MTYLTKNVYDVIKQRSLFGFEERKKEVNYMDAKVFGKFIMERRKQLGMTQAELAEKINVTDKAVSRWERGLSVPDSDMLITLADELDTSVSVLLGETVMEPMTDDLKAISEKLEVINLQLAKRNMFKVKTIRWILITLCAFIVLAFIALAVMQSFYLRWDYNNPEFAVAGTILHGFEFVFVRLAPLAFIASIIGIVITYKKR